MRVFTIRWDDYFRSFICKFKVRCPRCNVINKHAQSFTVFPQHLILTGARSCDRCGYDYIYYQNFH